MTKFHNLIFIIIIINLIILKVNSQKILKAESFINSKNSQFGPLIEGTSVNKIGEAFATNFNNKTFDIGNIAPNQKLYFNSPIITSQFNGIRFLPLNDNDIKSNIKNIALLANKNGDITKIIETNDGIVKQEIFCKDKSFVFPNDLTLSFKTGRIYISGQNFTNTTEIGDGGLWICYPDGKSLLLKSLGRTNGIELTIDEKFLYLSEAFNKNFKAISNKIWKFEIDINTGLISNSPPELFVDFEKLDGTQSIDVDGMRIDIEGNLYVTRNGGKQVVIFSPNKEVLGRIDLNIKEPTNLEFAGKEGKTMFIVGKCLDDGTKGCVDTIENDIPGRAFTSLNQ